MIPRRIFTLIALFMAIAFASDDRPPSFVQTITAEEIATAGVMRLSEVLLLSDLWEMGTTDGMNWSITANGLGIQQQQHIAIFIDGQKVDANLFDMINPNLLGFPLSQIDSLHIGSSPSIINGEMTNGGYVHIFTRHGSARWKFTGNGGTGNETGDPGPYRYTEHNTTNIDRVGGSKAAVLELNRRDMQVVISAVEQENNYSDMAMMGRTSDIATVFPWVYSLTPSIRVSSNMLGGWQNLQVTYGEANTFFAFSQPLGFEAPAYLKLGSVGVDGSLQSSDKTAWNYRWHYSSHDLAKLPNTIDFAFDWRQVHISGNIEMVTTEWATEIKLGLGGDQFRLDTDAFLTDNKYTLIKAYAAASKWISPNFQTSIMGLMNQVDGRISGNLVTSASWQITSANQFDFSYTYANRLNALENPHLIWLSRGYDLYQWSNSNSIRVDDLMSPSRQQTVDIDWRSYLSSIISINFGASYRKVDGLLMEKRQIGYDPSNFHFPTVITLIGNESYTTVGIHLSAQGQLSPYMRWRLAGRLWSILDATPLAEAEWEKIPYQQIKAQLIWTPVESFAIWLMATQVPSTYWTEYEAIDGTPYPRGTPRGNYLANVQGWTRVDLQIKKQFSNQRFALYLLLRNLLDKEVRYHPVGATFHFTLHLKGEIVLSAE